MRTGATGFLHVGSELEQAARPRLIVGTRRDQTAILSPNGLRLSGERKRVRRSRLVSRARRVGSVPGAQWIQRPDLRPDRASRGGPLAADGYLVSWTRRHRRTTEIPERARTTLGLQERSRSPAPRCSPPQRDRCRFQASLISSRRSSSNFTILPTSRAGTRNSRPARSEAPSRTSLLPQPIAHARASEPLHGRRRTLGF